MDNVDGQLCSNDPHFYQACGMTSQTRITNDEQLCGESLCTYKDGPKSHITLKLIRAIGIDCDGNLDCLNSELDEEGCPDPTNMTTLLSGRQVPTTMVCDDVCDGNDCEDEAICNGYRYGLYCKVKGLHDKIHYTYLADSGLGLSSICGGFVHCPNGEDEANCTVTNDSVNTCEHVRTQRIVPVHNYTRCAVLHVEGHSTKYYTKKNYCTDFASEQTNCSDPDRVYASCQINGYMSTISKYVICLGKQICDDNIENACLGPSFDCHVHKHLMCDGQQDCNDNKDETHISCREKTQQTCKRRVGKGGKLQIPLSWLGDEVMDCIDGRDEEKIWPTCGKGKSLRVVTVDKICQNVFLCPWDEPSFVELSGLCDGLQTCGNENKVCSESRSSARISTTVLTTDRGLSKHLAFCIKGLKIIGHFKDCSTFPSFIFPNHNFFGVTERTSVIIPTELQSCDHMFGELYVYTSCTSSCISSPCPLKNIPRYEVCPEQYPNRIGTVVNNEYLAFFTKSFGDFYTNRYFVCDNKVKCIDYSNVCNLVDDCGDGSDEEPCTNHFKCNSTGYYILKTSKCNGLFGCLDLSDECNVDCSRHILEDIILKVFSWSIGFVSVLANLVIISKSIVTLKRCRTIAALLNKSFIIAISVGDLLVGCYLFIIAIYDGIIFREDYCLKQINWITSVTCSEIGVLSTVGSQLSLFAMCGLSLTRTYGLYYSMRIPVAVTWIKSFQVFLGLLIMMISSLSIAIIPIVGIFDNFFVNGVNFAEELKVFIGTPNKQKVLAVLEAYYGRMMGIKLSWRMIRQMVTEMYSHDFLYRDHTTKISKVDFYGNDGVCLFKFFVKNDDPQRDFVWTILALNLVCFILITVTCLFIGYLSQKSSRKIHLAGSNREIFQRNRKIDRKISIIIATDFICWIPFIVICVLHSFEVLDATPWYGVSSVIILPINSVMNPLIYGNSLAILIKIKIPFQILKSFITRTEFYQTLTETLTREFQRIVQTLRTLLGLSTTAETIELGEVVTTRQMGDEREVEQSINNRTSQMSDVIGNSS